MTQVPYTFGTEPGPIPLSQLDANFAVTPQYAKSAGNVVNPIQSSITTLGTLVALSVTGNVNAGNVRTTGSVSSYGNITSGNVNTGGTISAYGAVVGGSLTINSTASVTGTVVTGNVLTEGLVSATGNITGGNITTVGQLSTQGNVLAQGIVSAVGNIATDAYFVGNFLGNITGNISVNGSNTQVLFNNNGNVGAAGGLTYNSGSNTLGVLGVVSAQGDIIAGGIITVGGNLFVSGTTQLVGAATAPTAPTGTANNQVATTAFVQAQKASPTFTGVPTAPTAPTATANIQVATTEFVQAQKASPTFTGVPTAPTAPTGTANNQVATTAFVSNNIVPSGCILLWSGSIISIPNGWYLCDGANGTPNLTNRFIVGAGPAYAVGATGGSADSVVVSHSHNATVTDPGHSHSINGTIQLYGAPGLGSGVLTQISNSATGVASTNISVTNSATGASGTNTNLPPYYALAYIMKA